MVDAKNAHASLLSRAHLSAYTLVVGVAGHEHDYERMWPTYKDKTDSSNVEPKATIYVVTGAAGCSEMHEPFTKPQPPRSAYRSNTFGYNRLWIHNASHIHLEYVMTDPTYFGPDKYGAVIDDTWIIQHSHGPFFLDGAPKRQPFCGTRSTVEGDGAAEQRPCGVQYDHWADHVDVETGLVEIPSGSVWHRLKHDRPVPLSATDEKELLDSFNAFEVARRSRDAAQSALTPAPAAGRQEEMTWEDLSDARRSLYTL